MSLLKTFCLTIILVCTSSLTYADEEWSTSWNGVIGNPTDKFYPAAVIQHQQGGKTIVFIVEPSSREDSCNFAGTVLYPPNQIVMYVDEQAIRATAQCFRNNGDIIYNFWPSSEAGKQYVVSLFKAKVGPVVVKISQQRFTIPTTGFTKVWNSLSNDVL